jgi:hypothetical protein
MRAIGSLTLVVALVAVTGGAACRPRAVADDTPVTGGPRIDKITPDSVNTGQGQIVQITLTGSGFDASENTVAVGPVTLERIVSRNDGRTLRFTVPLTMRSNGGAPPLPLRGGRFPVTVTTARGVSNAVTLAIQ